MTEQRKQEAEEAAMLEMPLFPDRKNWIKGYLAACEKLEGEIKAAYEKGFKDGRDNLNEGIKTLGRNR